MFYSESTDYITITEKLQIQFFPKLENAIKDNKSLEELKNILLSYEYKKKQGTL